MPYNKRRKSGFRAVRSKLIECLKTGNFESDIRTGSVELKNHLAAGKITANQLAEILEACRGDQHEQAPHHQEPTIEIHIFQTSLKGQKWYVKAYFIGERAHFISVHPSRG